MGRIPPPPKRGFRLPVNQVVCGNNIEVVTPWPANCIDSIVTDPPYGLGFMGKEWDTFKQENVGRPKTTKLVYKTDYINGVPIKRKKPEIVTRDSGARRAGSYDYSRNSEFQQWFTIWAKEMLRICKPGAIMLCFGGTRTYHRLTCAIEDAGWEIRDCMMWLYGSGFPKSHDISKAIDKKTGAKRTKGERLWSGGKRSGGISHGGEQSGTAERKIYDVPATPLAQLWNGYGTALKPAWEPIIVAMKPLDDTFANNAEKYGVAGLNIDGGRIGIEQRKTSWMSKNSKDAFNRDDNWKPKNGQTISQGRWPANLILSHHPECWVGDNGKISCHPDCPVRILDKQSGITKSGKMKVGQKRKKSKGAGGYHNNFPDEATAVETYGDSGGASRFFYCAKTSRKERNMGMEDCEDKLLARSGGAQGAEKSGKDEYLQDHIGLNRVAKVKNNHPTVKPLALMKYLCILLKMPDQNQIILDPFMGSGTTGIACVELGINYIGIEREQEYCEIGKKRIAAINRGDQDGKKCKNQNNKK